MWDGKDLSDQNPLPVFLRQGILDLSKIIMYEFQYDHMKLKYARDMGMAYEDHLKLYYMDTDSLLYDIAMDKIYKDIASDVVARFDTSSYSEDHSLPKSKNKKVISLIKDKLGGRIMIDFMVLGPKLYACERLARGSSGAL